MHINETRGLYPQNPEYGTFWRTNTQFLSFFFLQLYLQHVQVPRLGVESKLQLPAYTIATATLDLSHIWTYATVHGNARSLTYWARPGIKTASSQTLCQVPNPLSQNGNSPSFFNKHKAQKKDVREICSFQEILRNKSTWCDMWSSPGSWFKWINWKAE